MVVIHWIGRYPRRERAGSISFGATASKPSPSFSISAASPSEVGAAQFIDFVVNDREANRILAGERGVSIATAVRKDLRAIADEARGKVFDFIALVADHDASPIDPHGPPPAGEVLRLFRNVMREVLLFRMSSREGAERFMAEANTILANW